MKRQSRGFTLLELMVAIAVLGILLGLGVPTFRDFSRNNTVTAAQNDLVTALSVARSEALRRSRPVTVCASGDGEACGSDEDWGLGWMAFTDRGAPGTVDGDDVVLQIWQPAGAGLLFTADGAFVQYQGTGMTGAASTFDIAWDGCSGMRARHVVVIATGAITSAKQACE